MSADAEATPLKNRRNFGICAHVDAGKTTTTEQVLFLTGAKHRCGAVDEGNTTTDFMEMERDRGITIQAAAVSATWGAGGIQADLNLIDTPGHIDFTLEVARSMRVLDGAVIVICAKSGVQTNTPKVWRYADKHHVPRIIFVNKMDMVSNTVGSGLDRVLTQIREELKVRPVVLQLPIYENGQFCGVIDLIENKAQLWDDDQSNDGSVFRETAIPEHLKDWAEALRLELLEAAVDQDDNLIERYLSDESRITPAEIRAALRKGTLALKLFPVLCGSAFKKKAMQPLLDAVVHYLPSPLDLPAVTGLRPCGKEETCPTNDSAPLAALAFKVMEDKHGDLVFVRVYSGVLKPGMVVINSRNGSPSRVGRLLRMQGNQRIPIEKLAAGDIGVVQGLRDVITGDTLCLKERRITLEAITAPEPVVSLSIEPSERADLQPLLKALLALGKADPSFRVRFNPETGETIIAGLGELHLEVKLELLREAGIKARVGKPQVSYRETIAKSVRHSFTFKRQNGGHGMYAKIDFELQPLPRGSGCQFASKVRGGNLSQAFIRAAETGMKDSLGCGPVGGYQVVDVQISILDGAMHEVDSSEAAFQIAGSQGIAEALVLAEPHVLEPIMLLEVEVPSVFVGAAIGDIQQRRGQIVEQTIVAEQALLKVEIPLAETFGGKERLSYSNSLRSLSQGKGQFSLSPLCFKPVPPA
ncbi:MAG: elongation factor G [Candidatus Obscuribacterales bacterium]|nr:elongation factor G [Candidatus Obscuribacterales bacterium]